jgi:hypothetical protein
MKMETKKSLKKMAIGYAVFGLFIWFIFYYPPFYYSALPISGKLVDEESGEPLKGAIVIAIWQLEKGFGLEGTIPSRFMKVSEVLTDQEGHYFIEDWGPLRRPGGTYLGNFSPLLIYFKDGYIGMGRSNYADRFNYDDRMDRVQHSQWDGQIIKLKKFSGEMEGYNKIVSAVAMSLDVIFNPLFGANKCDWLMIPKMVRKFDEYDKAYIANNISASLIPDLTHLNSNYRCGSESEIKRALDLD